MDNEMLLALVENLLDHCEFIDMIDTKGRPVKEVIIQVDWRERSSKLVLGTPSSRHTFLADLIALKVFMEGDAPEAVASYVRNRKQTNIVKHRHGLGE